MKLRQAKKIGRQFGGYDGLDDWCLRHFGGWFPRQGAWRRLYRALKRLHREVLKHE